MYIEELSAQEILLEYRSAFTELRTKVQTHEMILKYADLHNEIIRRMKENKRGN